MIRVGFDGTIFGLQQVGGVSTYAWEILRRLAAAPDLQVTLGLPSCISRDRASVLAALQLKRQRELVPVGVARYLPIGLADDIVHSPYYRLPLSRHSKSVVTVHDFVYDRYRSGLARWVNLAQQRRACLMADAILCVSANTRSDLLTAYRQVDPAKVVVVPHGVDHSNFFVPATVFRSDLSDTVVFVGRRKGYKRFDLAVEAVALARKRLAIVGNMPDDAELALLRRRLGGRWTALGRVRDSELREIYAGAYALIYPSDYEGFGLPILEAHACGCPAVVANLSSFPEVGGVAALYAEAQTPEVYASRLTDLENSDMRAKIVANGVANAAKFNWDNTFHLTIAAYARALDWPMRRS